MNLRSTLIYINGDAGVNTMSFHGNFEYAQRVIQYHIL